MPHPIAEPLEPRRLCAAADVLVRHGTAANDGADLAETVLAPATVSPATFGKRFATALDGQAWAQPLYVQNVNVTRGPAPGVHAVAYVATLHDSLYALDANTGAVLWQDSFLNPADPTRTTPAAGVTAQPSDQIGTNAGPEQGILGTPTIDPVTGRLYLVAATREVRGADVHFVQRLWAVNLADGAPAVAPAVVGDTISNGPRKPFTGYVYVAGPIVAGTGNNGPTAAVATAYPNNDGWASAPAGATTPVLAFNALTQAQRPGLTLLNGRVYVAFGPHSDYSPYYGWVIGFDAATLALTAAWVDTPTYAGIVGNGGPGWTAQGGIWAGGSALTTDGTSLFVTTGNGAFNPDPANFDPAGFPRDHNFGDSLVRLDPDPASSPTNPNGNGFGLRVADYFTPANAYALDVLDLDFGSTAPTLLPDAITTPAGHPVLVVGGKESRLYVLDRTDLGKFDADYPRAVAPFTADADPRPYDRVVNEYAGNGTAVNSKARGIYSTASYLNGTVYVGQATTGLLAFDAADLAAGRPPVPKQVSQPFAFPDPTLTVTANGTAGGLLWGMDYANSALVAYDAADLSAPLYSSNAVPADAYAGGPKFAVPTVANAAAYVGTTAATLVGYGIRPAALTAATFAAPTTLAITPAGRLTWATRSPLAALFRVDRSADGGATWATLAYVPAATTAYDVPTTSADAYRVVAVNGSAATAPSNTATLAPATTVGPLTGTPIGTPGSYANRGNTIAKAFDGNPSTYFDAPTANGTWAGLDLGTPRAITAVAYAPRSGYAGRMVGGAVQASTTPDFSAAVVTLFTITATPTTGRLTTQPVGVAAAYRYVRYLSPTGGYGNVAEVQFLGPTAPAPVRLTGTAIGTPGSWGNRGNTIAKVFDGSTSTFFDAPTADGNWAGLDLGAPAVVRQIAYAPRSGYTARMVGGAFQASDTADFSANVVTLYTIAAVPPAGRLTTVTLPATATPFRYVRYLAPAGSYGNVAELQLFGTA